MVYKNFRFHCISRVISIGASVFLFFYLMFQTELYIAISVVGAVILIQLFSLIRYIEKTNRDLSRFLLSVKYSDFSQTFTKDGRGGSFDELRSAFNEVLNKFRQTRAEKEEHSRFLQTIVQHVGIALIAYGSDGEVELINTPAKRLFKISYLKNIQSLESFSRPLTERLKTLKSGEKSFIKIEDNNDLLQLAIYSTELRLSGRNLILVSIQNIQSELEETEMEAWHNLIRVLTHEIMNSITPISSLASTVDDILNDTDSTGKEKSDEKYQKDFISDVRSAVQTIRKRSQGLLHFVDNYRNLTSIPKPDFRIISASELFGRISQLLRQRFQENGIKFQMSVEPASLELPVDPELIEQVLINLLMNSIQALGEQNDAQINLEAGLDERGKIVVRVSDNGPGITKEVLEKIFIPFFTTRKSGSGIGLSLSRQIMRLHGGTIGALSKPNERTVFTLKF